MLYPSELDKAWAAGLFDGEGTVFISKRVARDALVGYRYQLCTRVGITHAPTVKRFADLFGGAATVEDRRTRRTCFWWGITGIPSCSQFLRQILPYAVTKRDQILLALESAEQWGGARGRAILSPETLALREGYYLALKEAKVS